MTQDRPKDLCRCANGRLFVGMKVNEALAETAAVVAGGDTYETGRIYRGSNGRLRSMNKLAEVATIDDDLHHGANAAG